MDNIIDLTNDGNDKSRPIHLDSEDEDEDLRRAIAMSLQDQADGISTCSPLASRTTEVRSATSDATTQETGCSESAQATLSNLGIPGLDRKQMEEERLARLKRKRGQVSDTSSRTISPPPVQRKGASQPPLSTLSNGTVKDSANVETQRRVAFPYLQGTILLTSDPPRWQRQTPSNRSQIQPLTSTSFPNLIAPTVSTAPLKSAFLSTFIVDFDWLFQHFDTRNVSFVLALHSTNSEHRDMLGRDFSGIPNVKLVLPPIGPGSGSGVNCMHSKIMLLFYESAADENDRLISENARCRIIVPSANLVSFDYGVGGVMENVLFVIDLPPVSREAANRLETRFKAELVKQLRALGTHCAVIEKLNAFDFSQTNKIGFVHSVGGSHLLESVDTRLSSFPQQKQTKLNGFMDVSAPKAAGKPDQGNKSGIGGGIATSADSHCGRTGLYSLSDTIKDLRLAVIPNLETGSAGTDDYSYPITLDYVASSLGNLNASFLKTLYFAACGQVPEDPASLAPMNRSKAKLRLNHDALSDPLSKDPMFEHVKKHLRVYFPSEETVRSSRGGTNSAGTICFQSKWWDTKDSHEQTPTNDSFPSTCLRDCKGVREDGTLMHSKILYVRYRRPKAVQQLDGEEVYYAGWIYVGSANLSESAWGKISNNARSKQTKITCRNWESGIVIPVPLSDVLSQQQSSGKADIAKIDLSKMSLEQVFGGIFQVPIQYPGLSFVESGKRPWFFNG